MATGREPELHLRLLRGFDLRRGGVPCDLPLSSQRVLAFVALRDRRVSRSFVAGSLWPDTTDAKAAANLRTALWRMGGAGDDLLSTSSNQLFLHRDVRVDVRELERLASALTGARGGPSVTTLDPNDIAGELLPDWWDAWLVIERERLRQLSLHALEQLCLRLIDDGQYDRAVQAGLAAVGVEPLRESATRILIAAHLAEGNRSEARRHFDWYRALLDESLGLAPSPTLAALVAMEPSLTRE